MYEIAGTKRPLEDTSIEEKQERKRPTASERKKRDEEKFYVKKGKKKVARSVDEGAEVVAPQPTVHTASDTTVEHALEAAVEPPVDPALSLASEATGASLATEVREDPELAVRGNVEGFIELQVPQELGEDSDDASASGDESESDDHHEERSKTKHDVRIEGESERDEESESGSGEDSETEGEETESDGDREIEREREEESVSQSESESEEEEIVASRGTKGKEKVVAKGKRKANTKRQSQPSSSVTTEFPGGPKNTQILKSFDTHIARYIWDGQDREPLKCIQHVTKIFEWHWKTECNRFKTRVSNTPLCQLKQVSYTHINRVLISAFVERWHPETNTFHLPFGEMTITLDDVKQITGLPVVGNSVRAKDIRKEDAIGLLHKLLGVRQEAALEELKINKCNYVRMEWLRRTFANKAKETDSIAVIDRHVRAYLLYLLGCTLFSDKTGTKVPVTYLNLLADVGDVGNYAWGTAGLAYLYRQLGIASRVEVKQIAGYLTLMEAWIYEHFTVERPTPDLDYVNGNPRAMKWKPQSSVSAADAPNRLKFLRQLIDNIIKENVIWDPYHGNRDAHPFEDIAWYCGCIAFCEQVEPYHPARVLRQFGYVQTNPWNHEPIPPTKANRGAKANLYSVEHIYVEYLWTSWRHYCLSPSSRGEICDADSPWMAENGYEEWYSERSHVRIHPTDSTFASDHPLPRSYGDAYIDLNNRRKKALTILHDSLKLGERQTLNNLLERVRNVVSILGDDTAHAVAPAVREVETDTGLASQGTSSMVRGRGRGLRTTAG